jgi:hypothetical protein
LLVLVTLAPPIGALKALMTFHVEPLNCHSRPVPFGTAENARTSAVPFVGMYVL